MKRRVFCLVLALALTAALIACGKSGSSSSDSGENAAAPAEQSQTVENSETAPADTADTTDTAAASDEQVQEPMVPGKLYQLNLEEGEDPIIRGIHLAGNIAGSTEWNQKDPGTEGIRCIFELNEWVEIYPDTDAADDLKVWVLKHGENGNSYEDVKFSDEMPGFAAELSLEYSDEESPWGSFYLNPEDAETGYYDLVFTRGGKATAMVLTRFYEEGGLGEKSDSDLDKIKNGLEAQ